MENGGQLGNSRLICTSSLETALRTIVPTKLDYNSHEPPSAPGKRNLTASCSAKSRSARDGNVNVGFGGWVFPGFYRRGTDEWANSWTFLSSPLSFHSSIFSGKCRLTGVGRVCVCSVLLGAPRGNSTGEAKWILTGPWTVE